MATMSVLPGSGGAASKGGEPAVDLAALMREPALGRRCPGRGSGFVDDQNRGVGDAVGEPRQRQRLEARQAARRHQRVGAGHLCQKFDDHAAVVDRRAVGQ